MKFCDNPLCRCHVEAEGQCNRLQYIEANGRLVVTARHTVIVRPTVSTEPLEPKTFFFCDTCVKAVAMVNSPD